MEKKTKYTSALKKSILSEAKQNQNNDTLKKKLALENGIDFYFEIDCRKSNIEWIKTNTENPNISLIKLAGNLAITGFRCSFLEQYIVFNGNIKNCTIVAATAIPTDANPKYNAIKLAIGAITVANISTSFLNIYFS